jgi:hypothetical protein
MLKLARRPTNFTFNKNLQRCYADPAPAVPKKSGSKLKFLAIVALGAAGGVVYVIMTRDEAESEPQYGLNYVKDAKRTPHLDIGYQFCPF